MNETKDNSGQRLYRVRIYKDFDIPSFSVDENNKLSDLYTKSLEEVIENSHDNRNYFDFEILHVMPFAFKKELPKDLDNRWRNDFNFFIREIAINDLEAKFGKLDYKINPSIFDKRTKNDGNGVDPYSPYNLKTELEDYFSERVKHYISVLENKVI